uniref:Mitochondrial assembly of ribosomal large subunit protein 1 n=1 Tax=Mola mola TaxID=94237 RepID=A0A3Q4ADM8_MOLML
MLRVLHCCKKRPPLVFKSNVLLEQTRVFTNARHGPCLPPAFTANVSLCRRWCQVHTSQSHTKRLYSENCNESSNLRRSAGEFQADSHETESDSSQRSSVTFSLDVLVSLLRQENAVDICVIKVPEQITYADYFIVVSGVSARHLRAMALYAIKVYKFLKKESEPNVKIEGKDTEDWMCIDFGNMVVHFMLPETREVYELEKLWTLRAYDEQLKNIPPETLPEDFIYDNADITK